MTGLIRGLLIKVAVWGPRHKHSSPAWVELEICRGEKECVGRPGRYSNPSFLSAEFSVENMSVPS